MKQANIIKNDHGYCLGYPEVVKTLLSNGAETTFKDKKVISVCHFNSKY